MVCEACTHADGTYFVKRTEAGYSSWILTYIVNIEPYKQELGNIAQKMDGFKTLFQEFQQGIQLKQNCTWEIVLIWAIQLLKILN